MHRDFIKCNPTNTGHYEYPKFETLSYDEGCHKWEVPRYLNRKDIEKYVVFYTRHTDTSRRSESKVVGYFKVGNEDHFTWKLGCTKRGFYSSESVLLPKDHCIPIDYSSRGVPVSWGNNRYDYGGTGSRLICVVYTDYNSTHYINVNYFLLVAQVANIYDFDDNEFSPYRWTLFVPKRQGANTTKLLGYSMGIGVVITAIIYIGASKVWTSINDFVRKYGR